MRIRLSMLFGLSLLLSAGASWAHDPVFSPGPHTIYRGGYEIHMEAAREEAGGEAEKEYELALFYGLTADWVVGVELPYEDAEETGAADAALRTKYRFWRDDRLGVQESAAVLGRVKLDTAGCDLGSGSTDWMAGATYGYESLTWYRWASFRYRHNGEGHHGLRQGDRLFLDLAAGIRPGELAYRAPDTVWMLELNAELTDRSERDGNELANTGGDAFFLSPGVMWTRRNLAVKAGVQIPVYDDLNGDQEAQDYRALLEVELHL